MPDTAVSALYYPHTAIRSEKLLKAALLLWDNIECIVPRGRTASKKVSRTVAEATELVVKPHLPSREARLRVHHRLAAFLKDGPPSWLRANAGPGGVPAHYLMYADKLLDETWRLLEHYDLVELSKYDRDYSVPPALGLLALAMLADECAGITRTKVTDREQAYSWLVAVMTTELGGEFLPKLDASHLSESYDRLVTASVRILNTDSIPLKRLVSFRKKNDVALRPLRKKYLQKVSEQVKAMVAPNVTATDKTEIVRAFEADMRDDLKALKKELRYAAKDVLFSKEIGVTALAVAGSALAPASIPLAASTLKTVGVGALFGTLAKYRKAREKAFGDHPMSWLYNVA